MHMKRYTMIMKLFAGAMMLLYLAGCSSNETHLKEEAPIAVSLAKPVSMASDVVTVSGQVEAVQTAMISTRIMGYITKMNVRAGDHVRKGQLLFAVNHDDLQAKGAQADAQIVRAEAQLRNAQKDYERFSALYKQQSATAKELENMQLQYDAAKASAEAARQMRREVNASFSYTNVTAPFDGVITAKNADAGSIANPGMPILVLEAAGGFRIAAAIPESEIAGIAIGDKAGIDLKSINRSFAGTVAEINPSSGPGGGQYPVKISIPAGQFKGLYAGMYANISIQMKHGGTGKAGAQKILIPLAAVVHKDQLTGIYTAGENKKALLRWIRLGRQYGNEVEVLSGLGVDDSFILKADGRLYNGAGIAVK